MAGEAEAVLRRIDEGSHGRCEKCGDPIPVKRLRSLPSTSRCVACADRRHLQRAARAETYRNAS
ncbi:MAG TPA: TraR/DksA C4-type zinc finger protein [Acidimicrobiia bacterium]|nr:TraR/DksA C4-type zinc finger protein [Acidimicrobiia bacterium]